MPPTALADGHLIIHVLNVGAGDSIVIEFPRESGGEKKLGIVDCYKSAKTVDYVKAIAQIRPYTEVAFVCATHPHYDHVAGIQTLLTTPETRPTEFWDSGFRHQTVTYQRILETVASQGIRMERVSSGMERYFGPVRLTALAPSIALRNRYATYGVDVNNASIVLRLEYCSQDAVTVQSLRYSGKRDVDLERSTPTSVAILGADAEFDSWSKVAEEFPYLHKTSKHSPLVNKVVNLLNCHFLKISHHGSMHSTPLDVLESMSPALAAASNKQELSSLSTPHGTFQRNLFPHDICVLALREVKAKICTTDGSLAHGEPTWKRPGSIVAGFFSSGSRGAVKLDDDVNTVPAPPTHM